MGLAATAAASIGSVALFGCEFDETETPPPPPPPRSGNYPGSEAPSSPGAAKQTKAEAQYQDDPNGSEHCGACANFVAPDDCRIVRGPVSPDGWCKNFRAHG